MKKKNIRIEDLYSLKFLRELALSPDGKKIVYTIEWLDKKKNEYFSNLYVVTADGKSRHYIRGNKKIHNPKWSPDGTKISFLMTEKKEQHIWVIPADGGEAYSLTKVKGSFGKYVWSSDNAHIVCEFTERKEDKERIPEKDKPPLYYHVKEMWYKLDGRGMLPAEKAHIWKVNVRSGKMTQLTHGEHGDHQPSVSPDGKWIVFYSNRNKNWLEKFLYIDLYIIDVNGKKERKITTPAGPKGAPVFSPDGQMIAYIGRQNPEQWAGWYNDYVWIVPVKGGKAVNISKSFDRTFSSLVIDDLGNYAQSYPIFSKDSRFVYVAATDYGNSYVYGIDVKHRKVVKVIGENEVVYAFDHDGADTFAIASSISTDSGNLHMISGRTRRQLIDLNKTYRQSHRIAKPEEFWFRGDKGDKIQGWVLKPPSFNKHKKYPLVVQIHGGPHAAYGNSLFHEFQVLAAHGYIVFYSNPHGSIGYGEKFARALHNRWGIPDSKDILKAVRSLMKRNYIDGKRMAVMGGSYGGFMTNWLIGHTNIFKAAVTMRSVVNLLSFFSSDFGFGLSKEFVGYWWEKRNFQFYWNMSPLKYVTKIKTPLLIIHSEQDHRCPISQGEELFVALKLLKRDVEMVRFPLEPHGLSRHGSPRRREKRLQFILEYVDRYLKK
jgi:dipeptidyl aminopeptidase/acylaminoacyl peptidase